LAEKGYEGIIAEQRPLCQGINVINGKVVNRAVAEALSLDFAAI